MPTASPVRLPTRKMWVSTAMVGSPKAMLSTTFAVLRPTPGKRFQRLAVVRHLAAVFLDELLRQPDHILGLGAKKPDGLDQIAHLGFAEFRHLLRRIGEREQSRRRLVDAGVGRLRRQHDGDQQRERVDVLQFAARRRVGGGETAERFFDLGFGPLRQFAVGGFGVGLDLRLAALETRRLALTGGLSWTLLLLGCFARHLAGIITAMADDTNDLPAEPTLFSAIITPHRSLSSTGFVIFMLCIGGISFAAGLVFLMLGAWPVFGFFGLDVALVYWAFRANYRSARAYEEVTVTATELTVRKISQRGEVREWTLNPVWVRLDRIVHEEFGIERLFLVSHGRRLSIANFLGADEKKSFATALSAALGEARRGPTRTVLE